MRWLPFNYDGKEYDLSHLHPRTVCYMQSARDGRMPNVYTVDVQFSLHCFSVGIDGRTPDPDLIYGDDRETRIFDFRRYALSHQLPSIIDGLLARKCFHADRRNFFTVEIIGENGTKLEYEIYFTATRSSKRGVINLFIQSAYTRDAAYGLNQPRRGQRKPISFGVILFNTLNKKLIVQPK